MSMRKTALAPGNFSFCSHGEKLPRQGGLLDVVQRVTRPLEVAPRQRKSHVNSYRRQTMHRGKFNPGSVSCPGAMSCHGIM